MVLSVIAAFSAGIFSFFSPCILPIIPLYLGYFSSGGNLRERITGTLCFVLGVSSVFFTFGALFGFVGSLFNSPIVTLFSGIFIILMGLFETGIIDIPILKKSATFDAGNRKGPFGAFILGLLFSIGWTPCVGPVLASVIALSLDSASAVSGFTLMLLYSAGMSIPFIIIALFSHALITKIKSLYPHLNKIKIAGGIIIIAVGIWITVGAIRNLGNVETEEVIAESNTLGGDYFSLSNEIGKKQIYLKFWGTWCPVCLAGIDEFSRLSNEYGDNDDVIIYSVVAPSLYGEMDEKEFSEWARAQGIDFPVLFDYGGRLNKLFSIRAYPTSVFISTDGMADVVVGHMSNDAISEKLGLTGEKE